jgi:hypothetical protein
MTEGWRWQSGDTGRDGVTLAKERWQCQREPWCDRECDSVILGESECDGDRECGTVTETAKKTEKGIVMRITAKERGNREGDRGWHWQRECENDGENHKVRIYEYIECHSVCLFVGIGTPPPTPFQQASMPLPPEPNGGGGTLACELGVGESQFRRLEKRVSTLSTLWLCCDRENGG